MVQSRRITLYAGKIQDQPGYFYFPSLVCFRVCREGLQTQDQKSLCNETVNLLVDVADAIINYTDENGEKICNNYTNLLLIKIIGALPIEQIECEVYHFHGDCLEIQK